MPRPSVQDLSDLQFVPPNLKFSSRSSDTVNYKKGLHLHWAQTEPWHLGLGGTNTEWDVVLIFISIFTSPHDTPRDGLEPNSLLRIQRFWNSFVSSWTWTPACWAHTWDIRSVQHLLSLLGIHLHNSSDTCSGDQLAHRESLLHLRGNTQSTL